jgi:hypothetical protein
MASMRALRHTLAATVIAAGCSGGDSSPDSGHPPDLRPATDAADVIEPPCVDLAKLVVSRAELCNTLPFPSTRVPFTVGTGSAPSFTGGTLVDGLYAAIKAEGWDTTASRGRQMGIVIGSSNDGKTLLWFGQTLNADGSGDVDAGTAGLGWLRANYKLTMVSDNTLGLGEDCLVGTTSGPPRLLYTATATNPPHLILANADSPNTAVVTYERQGCP